MQLVWSALGVVVILIVWLPLSANKFLPVCIIFLMVIMNTYQNDIVLVA